MAEEEGSDHYRTLGVARDASEAEIKSAYRRLVRIHRPEDDPDGFRAVSEAYRVLGDPAERREYDAQERLPAKVTETLERATSMAEKEPDRAVAAARSLLAEFDSSPAVKLAVACLFLRARRPAEAVPLLHGLAQANPSRFDYANLLGDAYLGAKRLDLADAAYRSALAIDASRPAAHLGLANVADARNRTSDAIAILDRGIVATGALDLRQAPLYFRKFVLLAQDGRWDDMSRVVTALESSVPAGDRDAAVQMASQFHDLSQRYAEVRAYDVAKFAVDAALRFDDHPALRAWSNRLGPLAETQREARRVFDDPAVAAWIKALLSTQMGPEVADTEFQRICDRAVAEIAGALLRCDGEWATFRSLYPRAAAHVSELKGQVRDAAVAARRRVRASSGGRASRTGMTGALGGICVVIAMFVVNSSRGCDTTPAPSLNLPSRVSTKPAPGAVLERLFRDDLEREEARLGRKMTASEIQTFLDDRRKELERIIREDLVRPPRRATQGGTK